MSACFIPSLAGITFAAFGAASAHGQVCVERARAEIGLSGLHVQNFEVVEAAPKRRVERRSFPGGAVLTANAAAAAIDAGQSAEAGVLADHDACAMTLGVEPREGGRMTAIFITETRS